MHVIGRQISNIFPGFRDALARPDSVSKVGVVFLDAGKREMARVFEFDEIDLTRTLGFKVNTDPYGSAFYYYTTLYLLPST